MNKDMIVRNVNVSPEDMELYKSLFIFSPDHKTFIDLDSYNYFVSKDGHGNLVSETGDPEEEIAVVDPALQQRIRLAYYTASDVITDDACWIGPGKVALLMLSHDERDKQDVFSAGLHIIDLSTHIESAFTSDLKMKIAATGEYTDNVRRKGIKMKR